MDDFDIRSVTFEQKDPTFKDFLKAAFAYATFRPALARSYMTGEQWLYGKNAAGEKVVGISGGSSMTIFAGTDKEEPRTEIVPQQQCRYKGGFRL